MRRSALFALPFVLGALVAVNPLAAKADADPAIGYGFVSYALPYHLATSAQKPGFTTGDWTTKKEVVRTGAALGLEAVGFGLGIGYDGWNVQLDVRSALSATNATLTGGYRLSFQIGNFEVWGRLGVGPALVLDYKHPGDTTRSASGGIQTVAEGGLDYFLWKDTVALGLKGVAAPSYSWQANFAADFAGNVGLRVIL